MVGHGLLFRDAVNHTLEAAAGKDTEIEVIKQAIAVSELGLMSNIEAVAQYLHRRAEAGKRNVDEVLIGDQQTGVVSVCALQVGLQ